MAEKIEIEKIIKQITEEVLKRLQGDVEKTPGTLAVFPDYVFDAPGITEYLKTKNDVACVLFENAQFACEGFAAKRVETVEDQRKLVSELTEYGEIILVTPPLSLIRAIAKGDDSVYAAMLCLRPLLWGKEVTLLLDFEAPRYKRNTVFSQIAEALNTLEAMQIKIASVKKKKTHKEEEKDLVTEQDIKEAYQNETMRVKAGKGAIVTQLAQDTAKELGVAIERQGI